MILASGLCFARVIPTPGLALEKASLTKAPKPVQDSPNQSAPCNWACNKANLNSGNDRFFPKSVNFVNKVNMSSQFVSQLIRYLLTASKKHQQWLCVPIFFISAKFLCELVRGTETTNFKVLKKKKTKKESNSSIFLQILNTRCMDTRLKQLDTLP